MVEISLVYNGDKNCNLTHGPSGATIGTDAPKDNQGLGRMFSPTDLVAGALGSCALTIMAMHAEKEGISLKGATAKVQKAMASNPRRIASLRVTIEMPPGVPQSSRAKLAEMADTCPVHKSLHPDVHAPIEITYPD